MPQHATGTFTVEVKPRNPPPAEGIGRFSINKRLTGDLTGATTGEMYSAGDPKAGAAGYVAIEMFRGSLSGKRGTFALQHTATIDSSGQKMAVSVVPGSGTDELKGLSGDFAITIASGQHSYELTYTLPE